MAGHGEIRSKWKKEREKITLHFPGFRLLVSDNETSIIGWIYLNKMAYYVEVFFPSKYPDKLPEVRIPYHYIDPEYHKRGAKGSFCILGSREWIESASISGMINRVYRWLNKYEIWKQRNS